MQSLLLLVLGLAIVGACIWFLHRIQLRRTVENADRTAPLDALDDSGLPDFTGVAPQPVAVTVDATEVSIPDAVAEPVVAVPEPIAAVPATAPVVSGLVPASDLAPAPDLAASTSAPAPEATIAAAGSIAAADGTSASENWLAQIRSLRDGGDLDAALALSRAHFPKTQAFQQAAIILRQQMRDALEKFQPVDALLRELYHTAALADLFRTSSSHKPHDPLAALAAVRTHTFQYAALGHLRLKLLNKSDVRALEQLWGAPAAHRHTEDLLGDAWLTLCRAP